MISKIINNAVFSVVTALLLVALLGGGFFVLEPTMSRAATDQFIITQQILEEISFQVPAADVSMVSAIPGMTGGMATGSTYFVIRSNSEAGYTVDISFSNTPAMRGDITANTGIRNFGDSGEPSYNFTASTSAQFGYTVSASSTSDLDLSFKDNGSACNISTGDTAGKCWKGPSTTNFRIIDRATAAMSGATTTLTFSVQVPNNPTPALEEDFYTATATLTATNQ